MRVNRNKGLPGTDPGLVNQIPAGLFIRIASLVDLK